jgi:uncharacterized membrane protein
MTSLALVFTLSAIGISEVVYLIRTRKSLEKPICPIGGGCVIVLESKYNHTFGIHNDILGLIAYILISLSAAVLVIDVQQARYFALALILLVATASAMSVFLTYVQYKIIKAWCFWCVISAFTIWLMGLIIIISPPLI